MKHAKKHLVSLVAVTAFGFLALGSSNSKKENVTVTKAGEEPAQAPAPAKAAGKAIQTAATPPVAKIGDLVSFDDSEWTVLEAKELGQKLKSNNQFQEDAATEGKFVYVKFKVKNLTNKEERVMNLPKVVDSQGREFRTLDGQSFYLPKGVKTMALEALPPSMNREFGAIYEVPADASGLAFEARSLGALGGDKAKIALGF